MTCDAGDEGRHSDSNDECDGTQNADYQSQECSDANESPAVSEKTGKMGKNLTGQIQIS